MEPSVPVSEALALQFQDAATNLPGAKERLFSSLYRELRQLAERRLRKGAAISISPTTLVHETYLGMVGASAEFADRPRFMGYAARVMRNLIIDFARERRALKRGGNFHITQLDSQIADQLDAAGPDARELAQLSGALDELAVHDARLAEIVDLKYFCGFSFGEIATLREVSERTVERDWQKARIVLYGALREPG